jgi:hypothetical protein
MWALGVFIWVSSLPSRHPRTPAAAEAPLASLAPVPAPVPAPPPTSIPEPAAQVAAPALSGAPFRNAAAVRALDGKWREVAKCRRGKVWGKALTTITFAGDGSITHVEVGIPFAGTPTGDCIAGTLATTRVDPFGDGAAVVVYRVYVAPK